jgi:hypothetical protein
MQYSSNAPSAHDPSGQPILCMVMSIALSILGFEKFFM